jgi:hypothetical protein
MGQFERSFKWAETVLTPKNFGVRKVLAPSNNPMKSPILCFGPDKKSVLGMLSITQILNKIAGA